MKNNKKIINRLYFLMLPTFNLMLPTFNFNQMRVKLKGF